jgi:hypothetical protein
MWTVIAIILVFSILSFALSVIALMGMLKTSDRMELIESLLREDVQSPPTKTEDVSSQLMQAYNSLKSEEDKHLAFIDLAHKRQQSMGFDSGGELIPTNLTPQEQEILKDFYNKDASTHE